MKKMNKYAAIMLAATMTMGMSSTVFADTTETYATSALTIDSAAGHTYNVYQLLKGDVSGLTNGEGTLANIVEGENLSNDITAENFVKEVTGKSGSTLSDTAWKYVDGTAVTSVNGAADKEDTEEDESLVSVTVTDGYYVVEDTATDGTIISRYMVAVVGPTTMAPKNSSVPSVVKKVKDTNDSTAATSEWQDSADYDIGDSIPYQLTATLPTDYADYHTYYLSFNDTLSAGLTLQASTIKVTVGTTVLTDGYYIYGDQNNFKVVIYDLKTVAPSATKDTQVTVEYSATLNEKAKIGSEGNDNKVTLTYTTNPNVTTPTKPNGSDTPDDTTDDDKPGTPEKPSNPGDDKPGNETTPKTPENPGTTKEDKNVVFTYEVIVDKFANEAATGKELAGAEFTLSKVTVDADGKATETVVQTYTVSKNDAGTEFTFKGLDDGTYVLTETVTPTGYNTIKPQTFTVSATHDVTSDNPQLTELKAEAASGSIITFNADKTAGSVQTNVINESGTVLPSTGGIGTTIFYVSGMILVLGAGIVLITRRRIAR